MICCIRTEKQTQAVMLRKRSMQETIVVVHLHILFLLATPFLHFASDTEIKSLVQDKRLTHSSTA